MSFFEIDANADMVNSKEFYSDESVVYRINNICFVNKNITGDLILTIYRIRFRYFEQGFISQKEVFIDHKLDSVKQYDGHVNIDIQAKKEIFKAPADYPCDMYIYYTNCEEVYHFSTQKNAIEFANKLNRLVSPAKQDMLDEQGLTIAGQIINSAANAAVGSVKAIGKLIAGNRVAVTCTKCGVTQYVQKQPFVKCSSCGEKLKF